MPEPAGLGADSPRDDCRGRVAAPLLLVLLGACCSPARRAQDISIDLGDGQSFSLRTVQLFLLITLLCLAPGLAIMVTCFPFMVTVLSILRQAIGVQQAPPNMMIVSLALFLTWFVMEPVFTEAWDGRHRADDRRRAPARGGLRPGRWRRSAPSWTAASTPRPSTMLREAAPARRRAAPRPAALPLPLLVPAFLLSEIKRGFEVGFLIFLPFLVIDLVIAAVLMSMGMMMVPPAVVSLPFKLAFFVIADGWSLLAGAMVRSYAP